MCEGMKWNHLPVAGGIYDQHPELLRQWQIIWEEKANHDSKQNKEKESGPNIKNR